ncbi:MAG: M56 family metallopeptidase [Candidatus Aminicenantes bacterium]|nr:M56 family metallopeptidase [Candidatus Aminicenantes bacterium]
MNFFENIISAEWVLNTAIHSLVILAFGALIIHLLRHKAAPLRSGIALITMVALFLLPFLSGSLIQLNSLSLKTVISITYDLSMSPSDGIDYKTAEISSHGNSTDQAQKVRPFWSGPFFVKSINVFGIIWGTGFLFMLLRFGMGAISVRSLKKGMAEVRNPRFQAIIHSVEKIFPKNKKFGVFTSPKAPYPMATGVFKPVILFPEDFMNKYHDNQIKGILIHELSHIYHGDLAMGILQRFITSLFWWNPLAFVLSESYSRAREEVSDTHVLLLNDSKEYAECLIDLAEKTMLWKRLSLSVGLVSPHIPLKERVKHILSKERIMDTNIKKSTVMVMVAAAVLLVLGIAGSRLIFAIDKLETTSPKADFVLKDLAEQTQSEKDQKKDTSKKKNIKPPKLLKSVDPVYPKEARKAGIEGVVILEATTDIHGQVENVKVLRSTPELDQASIDAVKQWVYEPMLIDGEPQGVTFTVTCRFSLDEPVPIRASVDIKPPKLIKEVEPVYPEDAKKAGIEGVVKLEVTTNQYGEVIAAKILESIPELEKAAIDAVKKWEYEVKTIDGKKRGMIFPVTVKFTLK